LPGLRKGDSFVNNVLEYNGYSGSIEISIEDNCLYGKILFITDIVTYEADTVDDLKLQFREAVDDYLQTCQEIGKEPQKPFKGSFNIRISPQLHRRAAVSAANEGVSLNELTSKAIEYYLDKPDKAINITHNDHHHHYSSAGHNVSIIEDTFGDAGEEPRWQISQSILSH